LAMSLIWTDYEEVYYTTTANGAPCFEFTFYNQYFVSNGVTYSANGWMPDEWWDDGDTPPAGLWFPIANGSTVLVPNFQPACAMKTETDGYFYVPHTANLTVSFIKVEKLFNNTNLIGDQSGGTCPYLSFSNWPDGTVNILDYSVVSSAWGSTQGSSKWNYMADIVADGVINILDLSQIEANWGCTGTYITNLSGVTLTFNTGQQLSPDASGYIAIPQNATNFTVKQNGNPIGALLTFWKNI